jgi:hypothetical protein
VENIVLGLTLGLAVVSFFVIIAISIRLVVMSAETVTLLKASYVSLNKIEQLSQANMEASEKFLDALENVANDNHMHTGNMMLYKTSDGRHMGSSMQDLIDKMKQDPTYKQADIYKDMDELRKLFEDNSQDTDDDDEMDSNEPWKGK